MTDQAALLAAILADPKDDTVRLAFADWLGEKASEKDCPSCEAVRLPDRGGLWPCRACGAENWDERGHVSNGFTERAEFIRVQVELARMNPRESPLEYLRYDELRRRESDLITEDPARALNWFGLPQPWARVVRETPFTGDETEMPYAITRRGFIHEIRCPWAAWRDHADAITRAQPIERVTLTTPIEFQWGKSDWNGRTRTVTIAEQEVSVQYGTLLCTQNDRERDLYLLSRRWPRIEFELLPELRATSIPIAEQLHAMNAMDAARPTGPTAWSRLRRNRPD